MSDDRSVVVERVFDAPADLLFEAYTKPEHMTRWFGPSGYPLTHCDMDFRVGGTFRFAMTGPDGVRGPFFGGEYLEIVENQRIVYSNGFLEPFSDTIGTEKSVVTITFESRGDGTLLRVHTRFETDALKQAYVQLGYVEGVGSGLDHLEEFVR